MHYVHSFKSPCSLLRDSKWILGEHGNEIGFDRFKPESTSEVKISRRWPSKSRELDPIVVVTWILSWSSNSKSVHPVRSFSKFLLWDHYWKKTHLDPEDCSDYSIQSTFFLVKLNREGCWLMPKSSSREVWSSGRIRTNPHIRPITASRPQHYTFEANGLPNMWWCWWC